MDETMKSLRFRLLLLLAAVTALATVAIISHAQWSGWQYGCFECIDDNMGAPWPDQECLQVGSSQHGDGIRCREGTVGGFGKVCQTSGGACFNVNVGGGDDGDGPFHDDPSNCTVPVGTICPASCNSCTME